MGAISGWIAVGILTVVLAVGSVRHLAALRAEVRERRAQAEIEMHEAMAAGDIGRYRRARAVYEGRER